jgi:Protein of unknown function (DUF3574)
LHAPLWYHFFMGGLKTFIVAAVTALSWVSCWPAAAQQFACREPLKPMLRAELYFGRAMARGRSVNETQWARFVAREITPRFPDGLTMFDAKGQWRDGTHGAIVREPSKLVVIVMADDAGAREHIDAVAAAYRQRFRQKSVGLVLEPVCAAF